MTKRTWLWWIVVAGLLCLGIPVVVYLSRRGDPTVEWPASLELAGDISFAAGYTLLLIALVVSLVRACRRKKSPNSYFLFLTLGLASSLIAYIGFDVYARISIAHEALQHSTAEVLYYAITSPIASAMLMAPFIIVGWLSASIAERQNTPIGLALFVIGISILWYMAFWGHIGAQRSLIDHKWTAAALSVGLFPFHSVVVLAPLFLIALWLRREGKVERAANDT